MNLQTIINQVVVVAIPFMEDRATFSRPTITIDTSGGRGRSFTNTTPASVPCVLDIASLAQIQELAEKPVKGTAYTMTIPSQYSSAVVDVDSSCKAVVAARGVDGQRTFQVHGVGRIAGAIIQVLVSKSE